MGHHLQEVLDWTWLADGLPVKNDLVLQALVLRIGEGSALARGMEDTWNLWRAGID